MRGLECRHHSMDWPLGHICRSTLAVKRVVLTSSMAAVTSGPGQHPDRERHVFTEEDWSEINEHAMPYNYAKVPEALEGRGPGPALYAATARKRACPKPSVTPAVLLCRSTTRRSWRGRWRASRAGGCSCRSTRAW